MSGSLRGLSLRGRERRGLRGYAGKPFHPPLTDFPIVGYTFAAVFDVLSVLLSDGHVELAEQLYRAGTWTMLGGAAVSLLTALTGVADWVAMRGHAARTTAAIHGLIMTSVTVLVVIDLALRLTVYGSDLSSPVVILGLSVLIALATAGGAALGGSLVFDHGVNVEPVDEESRSVASQAHVTEANRRPGRA